MLFSTFNVLLCNSDIGFGDAMDGAVYSAPQYTLCAVQSLAFHFYIHLEPPIMATVK